MEALKDKDVEVRVRAARDLGEIARWQYGDDMRRGRTVPMWEDSTAFPVKPEGALAALSASLLNDQETVVRREAASALAKFGKEAVPALEQALIKDKVGEVRQSAAYALQRIGDHGIPSLLLALNSQDTDSRKQLFSVLSLYEIDAKRKTVLAVAELLKEEDSGLRHEAAAFLGNISGVAGAAIPALLAASRAEDKGGEPARRALQNVRKAPRASAAALMAFLKDPEPRIRLKAAEVLCDLGEGDAECLTCLLELVKRRDPDIRMNAAVVLGRYGSAAKDAAPALAEIVRNAAYLDSAFPAINTLGAFGPDAKVALPTL